MAPMLRKASLPCFRDSFWTCWFTSLSSSLFAR